MSWTPRWKHVTQIDANGSGRNDCWEASLARYLRERNPGVIASTDDWVLINQISIVARGYPDSAANGETYIAGCDASLQHYNIPIVWTDSYQAALNAPWSILLVDGPRLAPAQYLADWFASDDPNGNHFICWLPALGGAANHFNDPLAYNNGQQDCQYDLASVAQAFVGAFLLPTTNNGETGPITAATNAPCGLKAQANHTCVSLVKVPKGATVTNLGPTSTSDDTWRKVSYQGKTGWIPLANIAA